MNLERINDFKARVEKVEKRWNKNKTIEKRCQGFIPMLLCVYGALVTCLGISSVIASPENFAAMTVKIPVLPEAAHFFASIALEFDLPVWCGIIFSFFITIISVIIISVLFVALSKKDDVKIKVINDNESVLEQAKQLKKYIDEIEEKQKKDQTEDFFKLLSSYAFTICCIVIYTSMCLKVEWGLLYVGVFVLAATLLGWVVFGLIRSISISISKKLAGGIVDVSDSLFEIKVELQNEIDEETEKQNQMEQRIRIENEKKIRNENLEKGKKLYLEAVSGDEPDLEKLSLAASLGNNEAAMSIAENLYIQASSDRFTQREKNQAFEMIYGTLKLLEEYDNHTDDSKIFYISMCLQLEKLETEEDFRKALVQAGEIQQKGNLSERYNTICDTLIPLLVDGVNYFKVKEAPNDYSSTGFFQGGVCSYLVGDRCAKYCEHYSEQDIKDLCPPCYHMNDPMNCGKRKGY